MNLLFVTAFLTICGYTIQISIAQIVSVQLQTNQGILNGRNNTTSSFVYKSYQTTIHCSPSSTILYPSTIQEVQQIVKDAIGNGTTVKAFGSRHSITDVICTEGIPMSMHNFTSVIVNEDDTATVGAGLEMVDMLTALQEQGRSVIHVPAYGGITIGGAIGTGAHGSSLRHPTSLSDQVVSVKIVDGKGNIQIISDPTELQAFRVHLGLLGIIVEVTLKTVPLFKMTVRNNVESESVLLDGTALQWAQEFDWFEMWWFPSTRSVVVSKGNYTDASVSGNAYSNMIPNQLLAETIASKASLENFQATRDKLGLYGIQEVTQLSLHTNAVAKPPIYTENGVTVANPATGYGWKLMSNKCTTCPWDYDGNSLYPEESSMGCELNELPGVVTTIKDILSKAEATFPMIGIFIRFSKASDGLMAMSYGRPTVSFEWTTPLRSDPYKTSRDGIGGYQAILQAMIKEHDARPHWGKNGLYYFNPSIINSSHPTRDSFVQSMKKYDPNGIFLNKFGRRVLGTSADVDMDPQVTHCALQDYCVCSKDSDCAYLQKCVLVNGYPTCRDPRLLPPIF